MDCTNKNCPAYAKCLAPYRGSRCKATRATYGLGDPITNADRLRQMSDEELAKWFCVMNIDDCPDKAHQMKCTDKCYECWLDWLKSPVEPVEVDNDG